MNFDGFHPFTTLFFFGVCCKRGGRLYHTTAPSRCIPASYCHLSVILHTISIIPAKLQDNRAVFRIFIALLRFSFDSTLYNHSSAIFIKFSLYNNIRTIQPSSYAQHFFMFSLIENYCILHIFSMFTLHLQRFHFSKFQIILCYNMSVSK
jgi:hypothetical protein